MYGILSVVRKVIKTSSKLLTYDAADVFSGAPNNTSAASLQCSERAQNRPGREDNE